MKEGNEQIHLSEIVQRIIHKKWIYTIVLSSTFVVACCLILPVPRYYRSGVTLAPELGNVNGGGSLSDIAASMGFNLNNTVLSDAISPELYPELLKSNRFILQLVNTQVTNIEGDINTTYYNYLDKHQKQNPLMIPLYAVEKLFMKKVHPSSKSQQIDPFQLTKRENDIFGAIRNKISCSVDKKTNLITITVEDQDPLIAATMADTVRNKLQTFITEYRTSKARHDMDYYKQLTMKAKQTYEKARQAYGSYADANMEVMLESFKSKKDDLENDMQLKFNAYSTLNTQLQAAIAKVQEKTPVFTVVTSASVPLKPAGPKRMLFVAGMLFLAFIITTVYVSRDLIF
ncbi:chain-length determining protein [Hoylesella timonensis]|jgi:hypothetical protein|uniref:Chain-length determining protein n=2 Tax=Hoylesella timonensis TaxID=386414 RepID=A0A098YRI7_9BACT|nr:chain-length determining protein [Hoylesella timonensis]KGI21867.1 chain-length determining protein [Hoylesella timonensis S9-PR14]PMC08348.1 chain-length determining protein [Hoylesella timonensis]